MGTIKEIMYFDGMDRKNTDEMVKFATQRMDDMGIKNVVVVWSSGYTINKFREGIKGRTDLNVIAVTNPSPHSPAKGTMPIIVRDNDSPEVKKRKEEQIAQGITEIYVTITDPIKEELESEGIKVRYLNDDLILGEPLNLTGRNATRRDLLKPFGIPDHLRPLDIDAGEDMSLLTIFSQGMRVCVGCTVLAVKSELIPEGELTLALGGVCTGVILKAAPVVKDCLVREVIGFERGSTWKERGNQMG
ncbi:MAG: hypothetical protein JW762_02050 [Dehalococcoidales bacterium]|nr:hypothetical protein [Dehalococcoidales bacterium]